MTLGTLAEIRITSTQTTTQDLGGGSLQSLLQTAVTLADGVDAGEIDVIFSDTRQLAASGTESLDLSGALTDLYGDPAVFARVKVLAIKADADNTNNVLVSRPAALGWATLFAAASDQIILRPGAMFAVVAGDTDATGYGVTAGTADLLTITNSAAGTTVDYSIVVLGCSA